jgi:hypothetical protein
MKKIRLTLLSLLFCAITFAQSVPQGINYQALARDASGAVLMNQNLTIQFSVISDITTSAVSWQETHLVITNGYGLYTAIIGQGTSTNGGSSLTFDVIDWGASNHLLKVEVDYGGGLLDMGITAFMSVPYAINSANPGPAGANGLDGTDGTDGSAGVAGSIGATGLQGSTGAAGTDGIGIAQTLYISGDTLFISSGNYIILPSSIPTLLGCTDSTSTNYNALANTDDGSCLFLAIGDFYQGGIVFYLDGNGGGLISAHSNQSTAAEWGCYFTSVSGADGTAIGTGAQNTIDIVNANCFPYTAGNSIAANICANLTLGGYSDWFLPSKDELNEMYQNIGQGNALGLGNIGGFANNYYWSSSEYSANHAWTRFFDGGYQYYSSKTTTVNVRAVRAF